MKRKARILILILLILAAAVYMTACGGDGGAEDAESIRQSSQAPASPDDSTADITDNGADGSDDGESGHNDAHHDNHSILPEQTQPSDIGVKGAKAIALDMIPGASESDIREIEKEHDDGRLKYEGEIYYDGYEYEFEIDGATGNILKWEIDD